MNDVESRRIVDHGGDILAARLATRALIAVDFYQNPEPYERTYAITERVVGAERSPLAVAEAVRTVVAGTIPFSSLAVCRTLYTEAAAQKVERLIPEHAVPLSAFMEGNGGICHQQSLLGAALIWLLQQRRGIDGSVALVEQGSAATNPDRHVWVQYQTDTQQIAIDTCNNVVLALEDGSDPSSNPVVVQASKPYLI